MYKQVALVILDGWGLRDAVLGNALKCVPTPNLDALTRDYPWAKLDCSGEAVGLMPGQMGDSNVGHLNIGAGRIVYQDLARITRALAQGELKRNAVWRDLVTKTKETQGRVHLYGLLSLGGVHSHTDHLKEILRQCYDEGLTVFLHLLLDGRDAPPTSGQAWLAEIEKYVEDLGTGRIATVMGRYYGMDRDTRWERTAQAYEALTLGQGHGVARLSQAVLQQYAVGVTDEFLPPLVVSSEQPTAVLQDGDSLLFFNFRADRMRQIVQAFCYDKEVGFTRQSKPSVTIATFTRYHHAFPFPQIFQPDDLADTLGEVVSRAGLRQMRLAETEKYAHVTFFFSGGREEPFVGEDRLLIPSPRVATYDLVPEMSAKAVAEAFATNWTVGYDLVVMNFANLDMVGHTGVFPAVCQAVATVDEVVGRVVAQVLASGGALLLTADHGNAEEVFTESGQIHTAHTLNPVPCLVITPQNSLQVKEQGVLADIAPTVLELLGLAQPAKMTGKSLIKEAW
ncbi:MAG: 2,3-bisphosphoglycerate-independent phosphoglycerate mutase [Firmicutes bacterium]|nr:2,3-bisphosphoglycerate-independent phosphoglycerate mutase [Bacillota bacterium]